MLSCMVMCNVLQNNCTPLHFATSNNHAPLVEALVQAGADVNAINKVKQNDIYVVNSLMYIYQIH